MKNKIIPIVAAASMLVGCTKTSVKTASEEFNELPAAVQKSVRASEPNAEVADVDKDTRNGLEVYKIDFREPDRHPSIWVAPDGTVLKTDTERAMGRAPETVNANKGSGAQSELSALPLPVQKAINENAPKAEVSSIRRNEQNGRIYYDIEYAGKKENPTIQVAEDGSVVRALSKDQPAPRY